MEACAQVTYDSRDIERYDIDADEIGGRKKLRNILTGSGVTGDIDEILDTLLSGDFEKQQQLSEAAQNLISTFLKMRMVLGARKVLTEHNARGGQPELIFAKLDGIDIGDINSFTDLKHIDPNSSIEEKLFERLRYDAFGAVMRKMPGRNKEELEARERFRTTGRLTDLNFDASLGEAGGKSSSDTATNKVATPQFDIAVQLQKLADLHAAGALTDEEFREAKLKLLN